MNPDHLAMTASDRALLTAALSSDAEGTADAWRAWRGATDLDALPDGQYLMLSALYANLARLGLADEADPRIKGVYRRTWYANQRLAELAAAALAALGGMDIPAALGGAAAVQDLYGSLGGRPIGQIELLIAPGDVTRAAEALGRIGWQSVVASDLLADPGYRQWVHQAMFRRDRAEVQRLASVELLSLAWRVLPAAPAPSEGARFTALALEVTATPTRLRREAQLLLACVRAAEGGPDRLIALTDARMILRAVAPLNWELVVELADVLGAARPLTALVGESVERAVLVKLAQMSQNEIPYERLSDVRDLTGRVRFHLRRWRRIARGQGAALTPLSLLRYLQATAAVTRLRQLPRRLAQRVSILESRRRSS